MFQSVIVYIIKLLISVFKSYKAYLPLRYMNAKMYFMLSLCIYSGGKWSKQNLTYAIQRYPSIKHLSRLAVADEMEKALGTWAAVAELNFLSVQRNETADIKIMFVSGSHGDEMPFDGVGKVLAHASSPTSGKVHFDDDEPWTIRKYTGKIKYSLIRYCTK